MFVLHVPAFRGLMGNCMSSPEWADWRPLTAQSGRHGSAAYKLRLVVNGEPVPIPRFFAPDSEGILCIGETNNMERRRRAFVRAIRTGRGHSSGDLLCQLERAELLGRMWPGRAYEYSFSLLESKAAAKALQDESLEAYLLRYGDAPPLNSSIPRALRFHGFGSAARA